MHTLKELWIKPGAQPGLKVRYQDWNHRWKYFEITDVKDGRVEGKLCTGEKISYPATSRHWLVYHPGDEHIARAV
jgi:hypothetical protein